jgi:anion transporter
MHRLHQFATLCVVVAALALAVWRPEGVTPQIMLAAAVIVLTVGLWALASLPEHVTSLIFFLLAMLLAVAPATAVFSGFASATVWLVLSGLVIAEAVNRTGLGRRIAARLFARFTGSYARLATAVWGVATLLAFLMPATVARILLLVPIVYAAAEGVGLARPSRGAIGLVLVAILGTYQSGAAVIPANAPNLVLAGVAETLYGVELIYAKYLLLQGPVLALAKGAVIIALACLLFGEPVQAPAARGVPQPMSAGERRLAVVLVLALAFWATDFMHGIKAGWVALAAAIACLLPRVGMLPAAAFNDVRYSAVIYVAATIGMGAVSATSGLSDALGDWAERVIPLEPGASASNFLWLSGLATAVSMIATNPGLPALMGPLADNLAQAADWPIEAVLMTMAVGFTTMILPYQVPPVVVGLHAAGISVRKALLIVLPVAVVSLVVLIPLDYLWWRLIGYLP